MAFTIANWACTSGSLNQGQETVTPMGGSPTVLNSQNMFSYSSPTDLVATITSSGYFNSMASSLSAGDWIQGKGTDSTFSVYVTSITAGVVSVASTIQGSLAPLSVSGNFLIQPAADGLTAHAGGGQGSSYAITYPINRFTVVATAGDSAHLPVSVAGMEVVVINDAVNAMQVFGAGTNTINDIATATGVSQLGKSAVLYISSVAGKWYSIGLGLNFSGALASLGIHSATYSSSFSTASTTVTDAAITASSIVIARFVSSANVVTVQTVTPAAGSFTVVTDTAPSTGVLEYISFVPSTALVTAGVVGGVGSYGGGSATFTIADANITAGMVVNANFDTQVTPSKIYTVIATAGVLTFVCSANPGVCTIEYMGIIPSTALTNAGLYGANYSYAGGFASIVISDANITASSIVTADFKSQSVTALIQKVTPSAGTLTILASIDPGPSVVAYIATTNAVGGSFLETNNNLSDLASAATALVNLGLNVVDGGVIPTAGNALTAHAGGTQAAALALTHLVNNVTTTATAGDSVRLPVSVAGMSVSITNNGVASMQVYGAGTDTINGVATATGVAQLPGQTVIYNSPVAGLWYANGVGASINPNPILFASVAITAAQFNAMYATPILLVAAPGANKLILVENIELLMTYVSANYAAGGVAAGQYDSTANGAGVIATTTLSAATFQAAASTGFTFNTGVVPLTFSTCVNKGLYLSNITGAFTTGDSTFIAKVYYRVLNTTGAL